MKLYAPDYYKDFHCIASQCRHTCCAGWEIDIDADTYDCYSNVEGDFGERLRSGISTDGVPHFKLGEGERCPMLNNENLCDVIINLGEDALCSICAEHPRFYNCFSDRDEVGLGLCCESAASLILSRTKITRLCEIEGGDEFSVPTEEEKEFFRLRRQMFDIVQDRFRPIDDRANELLEFLEIEVLEKTADEWAAVFDKLERMNDEWSEMLDYIRKPIRLCDFRIRQYDRAFEQLMTYFLYRHLPKGLSDGYLRGRAAFSVLAVRIIRAIFVERAARRGVADMHDLIDTARMFSAEIEYCEENINSIFEMLDIDRKTVPAKLAVPV